MWAYLFVWTVVAHANPHYPPQADWRNQGEFRTVASCKAAATELGIKEDRYRCVVKEVK